MPARTLYLLRHAKSSWEAPGVPDHERPLSNRGRRACRALAEHLRETEVAPAAAIVSTAVRARQTLEGIREGLPERMAVWSEERLYGAAADDLLGVIQELPTVFRSALVIAHNPGVRELALMLAGDGERLAEVRRKYPTGALATLTFAGDWTTLRAGVAALEAFVRPKQLG